MKAIAEAEQAKKEFMAIAQKEHELKNPAPKNDTK
jgi:hypothetical protein